MVGKQAFTHVDVEYDVITFGRVHPYDDVKMMSTLPNIVLQAQLMISFVVQLVKWM